MTVGFESSLLFAVGLGSPFLWTAQGLLWCSTLLPEACHFPASVAADPAPSVETSRLCTAFYSDAADHSSARPSPKHGSVTNKGKGQVYWTNKLCSFVGAFEHLQTLQNKPKKLFHVFAALKCLFLVCQVKNIKKILLYRSHFAAVCVTLQRHVWGNPSPAAKHGGLTWGEHFDGSQPEEFHPPSSPRAEKGVHLVLVRCSRGSTWTTQVTNLFNYYECYCKMLWNKPNKQQFIYVFTRFYLAVIQLTVRKEKWQIWLIVTFDLFSFNLQTPFVVEEKNCDLT